MNFDFAEEEQAISHLSAQILGDRVSHEQLRSMTLEDEHLDRATWDLLAEAGVVSAALPEEHGGAGLGFLAVAAALEQVGEHAALVPLIETIVMAGLPIATFGSPDQQALFLPRIASGELIATAALVHGQGFTAVDGRVTGSAPCVPFGLEADLILVPTNDGVYIIETDRSPAADDGITRSVQQTTTGHPQALLTLSNTPGTRLGTASTDGIVDWIRLRVDAAICSTMAGVCKASLALLSEYAKTRQQFDRAIASFQAVSQRAGDAYIDAEAVNLTSRQAAWRISAGRPAREQVAIARWWAAEAGFRVVHAATHIHGGVGVDREYPLHRYFLMARQLELTLGNSEEQLERLGNLIAARS